MYFKQQINFLCNAQAFSQLLYNQIKIVNAEMGSSFTIDSHNARELTSEFIGRLEDDFSRFPSADVVLLVEEVLECHFVVMFDNIGSLIIEEPNMPENINNRPYYRTLILIKLYIKSLHRIFRDNDIEYPNNLTLNEIAIQITEEPNKAYSIAKLLNIPLDPYRLLN